MAAGFHFDGTDDYVTLADAAGYDVSPNGGSFTHAFWLTPDARSTPEVLFDRSGWFTVRLEADNTLSINLGGAAVRTVKPIPDGKKSHVMWAVKHQTALATGTADTNVATLLVDLDANWWTNGVNKTNTIDGKYVVYNRTDRVWGYGTVIDDVVFTAGASTVNTDTEVITTGTHNLVTGCPVIITGTDCPAGITSGNLYYVNAASATTVKLYDTAANAITGGATGLVDLTDAGSGAVTLRAREDAIQLDSDFCPDGNEAVMVFVPPWKAEIRVWINGVRQDINETMTNFNTPADSAEVINVAQLKGGSLFYDGKMNNIAYWTPGFATDEIAAAVYNDGTELTYAQTILVDGAMTAYGYWALDDSAASTAVDNDETTAARDGTSGANTNTYATTTLNPTSYFLEPRVIALDAANEEVTGRLVIEQMRWIGTTAGHDIRVTDSAGNTIWISVAETNNFTDAIVFGPKVVDGVKVHTIDSGTIYVYLA